MPRYNKCRRQRILSALRMCMVGRNNANKDNINEDEWISCQTDANKLVEKRRPKKGSLFGPDESWPEEPIKPSVTTGTEEPSTTIATTVSTEEPIESATKTHDVIDGEMILAHKPSSEEKLESDADGTDIAVADDEEVLPAPLEEWEIKNQLCRCCLVEGTFDSLLSPAPGDDLTYHDMLMQTFSIELFPVSSDVTTALRGVCGLCAARLRDAHAFRHQVRATEARFRDLYTHNCITVAGAATAEIELERETSDTDNRGTLLQYYLEESTELSPRKKKNCRAPAKPRRKKICNSVKKHVPTNEFVWTDNAYKCMRCEASFTRLLNLRRHFQKAHVQPKPNRPTKENTNVPSNEFVSTDDGYKCTKCKRNFTQLRSVQYHICRTHSTGLLKKCKLCENSFTSLIQLKNHKLKEHGIDERYKCGACDRAFNQKQQVDAHINSYHMMGEKRKCSMCDYECYNQNSMQRHVVKHKTSKDFQCKYCKKAFLRKSTLQYHERIHTGDKRKACAKCGQTFVQKASLNYHMAKYHPEVKF